MEDNNEKKQLNMVLPWTVSGVLFILLILSVTLPKNVAVTTEPQSTGTDIVLTYDSTAQKGKPCVYKAGKDYKPGEYEIILLEPKKEDFSISIKTKCYDSMEDREFSLTYACDEEELQHGLPYLGLSEGSELIVNENEMEFDQIVKIKLTPTTWKTRKSDEFFANKYRGTE